MTNTSGWPGTAQSGPTTTRPARSSGTPQRAPPAGSGARRRPTARCRRAPSRRRRARRRVVDPFDARRRCAPRRPARASCSRARWRERRLERRQDPIGHLDQHHARIASRSMRRKSRARMSRDRSAIAPASSTPVGPPPTTTNVSRRAARRDRRLALGRLEREQHAAADLERVVEILEPGRDAAPSRRGRSSWCRAPGRDDQVVVGERVPSSSRRAAAATIDAPSPRRAAPSTLRVRARRRARIGYAMSVGAEAGHRHLVEQRLEQVVVPAIDHRHLDRAAVAGRAPSPPTARRTRRR